MNLFPIVARELRVASRRISTYWIRFYLALSGLLVLGFFLVVLTNDFSRPAEMSIPLFTVLSFLAFFLCNLAGVYLTASALTDEKERGTLGLLFLTNLRGFDVVLGKLMSHSLQGIFGLLTIFPLIMMPVLMGGLDPAIVWRMVLVLLATLFLSLSAGMFFSSICRNSRWSMGLTLVFMLHLNLAGPFVAIMLEWFDVVSNRTSEHFIVACLGGFMASAYSAPPGFPWLFEAAFATTLGLSTILMLFAFFWAPRSWQDDPHGWWSKWKKRPHVASGWHSRRADFRREALDLQPIYWLSARNMKKPRHVWWALMIGALLWSLGILEDGTRWFDADVYLTTIWITITAFKLWIAIEACQRFSEDRRKGSLELLFSTPLSLREFAWGHFLAMRRQFQWPLALFAILTLAMLVHEPPPGVEETALMTCYFAVCLFDLWAMFWSGLHASLKSGRPRMAATWVILRIHLLPWVAWILFVFLISIYGSMGEWVALTTWTGICCANNLVWGTYGRSDLMKQFRQIANGTSKESLHKPA